MAAEKVLFDTTKDGKQVSEFIITRPNGESFSVIEYGAQHINHLISGCLTDDLMCPRTEGTDDIAFVILNARHV